MARADTLQQRPSFRRTAAKESADRIQLHLAAGRAEPAVETAFSPRADVVIRVGTPLHAMGGATDSGSGDRGRGPGISLRRQAADPRRAGAFARGRRTVAR